MLRHNQWNAANSIEYTSIKRKRIHHLIARRCCDTLLHVRPERCVPGFIYDSDPHEIMHLGRCDGKL